MRFCRIACGKASKPARHEWVGLLPYLTGCINGCYNARGAARLPGRKEEDGAWLLPSFPQKGVMIMTDYEILAIVLLMITLAFTVHNGSHKHK